jgi:hypothetical protein
MMTAFVFVIIYSNDATTWQFAFAYLIVEVDDACNFIIT